MSKNHFNSEALLHHLALKSYNFNFNNYWNNYGLLLVYIHNQNRNKI